MKRSRRAHHALRPVNVGTCPRCQKAKLPHRACMNCGYVNARVSIDVETEES